MIPFQKIASKPIQHTLIKISPKKCSWSNGRKITHPELIHTSSNHPMTIFSSSVKGHIELHKFKAYQISNFGHQKQQKYRDSIFTIPRSRTAIFSEVFGFSLAGSHRYKGNDPLEIVNDAKVAIVMSFLGTISKWFSGVGGMGALILFLEPSLSKSANEYFLKLHEGEDAINKMAKSSEIVNLNLNQIFKRLKTTRPSLVDLFLMEENISKRIGEVTLTKLEMDLLVNAYPLLMQHINNQLPFTLTPYRKGLFLSHLNELYKSSGLDDYFPLEAEIIKAQLIAKNFAAKDRFIPYALYVILWMVFCVHRSKSAANSPNNLEQINERKSRIHSIIFSLGLRSKIKWFKTLLSLKKRSEKENLSPEETEIIFNELSQEIKGRYITSNLSFLKANFRSWFYYYEVFDILNLLIKNVSKSDNSKMDVPAMRTQIAEFALKVAAQRTWPWKVVYKMQELLKTLTSEKLLNESDLTTFSKKCQSKEADAARARYNEINS
jgi:hypothetical protein